MVAHADSRTVDQFPSRHACESYSQTMTLLLFGGPPSLASPALPHSRTFLPSAAVSWVSLDSETIRRLAQAAQVGRVTFPDTGQHVVTDRSSISDSAVWRSWKSGDWWVSDLEALGPLSSQ